MVISTTNVEFIHQMKLASRAGYDASISYHVSTFISIHLPWQLLIVAIQNMPI